MGRWKLVADLARDQFGLVAVWQAAEVEVTRQLLHERAKDHGWTRACQGVYLLPGHQLGPLARIKAVELALREEGAASGLTALYLWGIAKSAPRPLPFVVPPRCCRRPKGAEIHLSKALATRPTLTRSGIRVVDPAWAICTAAGSHEVLELKRFVTTGHRLRLLTPRTVRKTVEELGAFKGRRYLVAALDEIENEGITHSGLERLGRNHLAGADLRPHPDPYPVEHEGRLIAELDIAFIAEQVGIPIQGPHHLEEDQRRFDEDQRYELETIGWRIIPADETRLKQQPEIFVRQVREALRARGNVTTI